MQSAGAGLGAAALLARLPDVGREVGHVRVGYLDVGTDPKANVDVGAERREILVPEVTELGDATVRRGVHRDRGCPPPVLDRRIETAMILRQYVQVAERLQCDDAMEVGGWIPQHYVVPFRTGAGRAGREAK